MQKIKLIALSLIFTSALAQTGIAPKAADLLEKAKTAHGGAALEGSGLAETVNISSF